MQVVAFGRCMYRAYGLIVAASTLFNLLLWVASGYWLEAFWIFMPLIVFVSVIVHEAGHVYMAKKCGVGVKFLARFGYMAVAYKSTPARSRIAASGPLIAAIFCAGLGVLNHGIFGWCLVFVGVMHLLCLLPWAADGKTIWRSFGS